MKQRSLLVPEFGLITPETSELPRTRMTFIPHDVKGAFKVNSLIKKSRPRSPPLTTRVALKQKAINAYARDVYISFNIIKIEPQDELEKIHEMEALEQYIEQETEYEQEMFLRGEPMQDYFFFNPPRDPRL